MALREFLGKRGTAWSIRSNNGKNFIEASKEAQKGLQVMNHDQINNYLQKTGADWIVWGKYPPGAWHMGGIWNNETLRILITETEAITNSCPLTVETLSDARSEISLLKSNKGTIQKKSASHGPTLPVVIFDKKVPFFPKTLLF